MFAAITKYNQFIGCGGWDDEIEEPEKDSDSAGSEVLEQRGLRRRVQADLLVRKTLGSYLTYS
jgi:hypothetical protein